MYSTGGQHQLIRIGIVSDSSLLQLTLRSFLQDLGHEVISFKPSDFRAKVGDSLANVDVIIVPQSVGKTTIREIAKKHPTIKMVILRDADGGGLSVKEALRYGVYAYLHQPIHLDELELILARLMPPDSNASADYAFEAYT